MSKHTQSKHNSTISFGARLFILILLASILSSCGVVIQTPIPAPTQESTLIPPTEVPPTEVPTQTPTITLTPEPTVTPSPEPTATETQIPTPVPLDELGIRVEIPLGEGMTGEELQSSVEWYYNLSDWELNQKIEGNLWRSVLNKNDSLPRLPGTSKIIRNYEDLGWYEGGNIVFPHATHDWNFFNTIYLGTIMDKGDGHEPLYISAFGTKDWLGNRFVIYADTGLYRLTECGDFQSGTSKDRILDGNKIKPIFDSKQANYELLNTNRGDIVGIIVERPVRLNYTKDQLKLCGQILFDFKGGNVIMNLIDEQKKELSTASARDLVDSALDVKFNKLPLKIISGKFYKSDEVCQNYATRSLISCFCLSK